MWLETEVWGKVRSGLEGKKITSVWTSNAVNLAVVCHWPMKSRQKLELLTARPNYASAWCRQRFRISATWQKGIAEIGDQPRTRRSNWLHTNKSLPAQCLQPSVTGWSVSQYHLRYSQSSPPPRFSLLTWHLHQDRPANIKHSHTMI